MGCLFIPDRLKDDIPKDVLMVKAKAKGGMEPEEYPIYKEVEGGILVAVGLWPKLTSYIGITPIKARPNISGKGSPFTGTLRPKQAEAVDIMMFKFETYSRLLCIAECGTGKTVMGLWLASQLGNGSVIILVDQANIADQWEAEIKHFIPKASVRKYHSSAVSLDKYDPTVEFNIVMAHSLRNWDYDEKGPLRCGLIIADETHVYAAPTFIQAMLNIEFDRSLGLTATPDRKDGLQHVFQDFVGNEEIEVVAPNLIPKVALIKYVTQVSSEDYKPFWCRYVTGMTHKAKCRGCDKFKGYPTKCPISRGKGGQPVTEPGQMAFTNMVQDLCLEPAYQDAVLKAGREFIAADRNAILFMPYLVPMRILYDIFLLEYGESKIGWYTSKSPLSEMDKQFTFTTYKMADKALDVPHKDALILGGSQSDIRQTVGRIRRLKSGKRQPIVVDFAISGNATFKRHVKKRIIQYKAMGSKIQWAT